MVIDFVDIVFYIMCEKIYAFINKMSCGKCIDTCSDTDKTLCVTDCECDQKEVKDGLHDTSDDIMQLMATSKMHYIGLVGLGFM